MKLIKKDIKNINKYYIKSLNKVFFNEYIIFINNNQKKLIVFIKINKKIYLIISKFFNLVLKKLITRLINFLNKY